jgi:hypothetical protein
MDNNYRMKIKVGDHEFEAEGPADVVNEQFKAFTDLIAKLPASAPHQTHSPARADESTGIMAAERRDMPSADSALDKIMRLDGRVISLTARPKSAEEAVLLLLYGQKVMRDNDSVTGSEVIDGLTATGGMQVARVDRLLEKAARDGDAIVIGERRGKRYRLTNAGLMKARTIAADLIAIVA